MMTIRNMPFFDIRLSDACSPPIAPFFLIEFQDQKLQRAFGDGLRLVSEEYKGCASALALYQTSSVQLEMASYENLTFTTVWQQWTFLGARAFVVHARNILSTIFWMEKRLLNRPGLPAQVDEERLEASRAIFEEVLPDAKKLRDAAVHPEIAIKAPGDFELSENGHSIRSTLIDHVYTYSFEGKIIGLAIRDETLGKIREGVVLFLQSMRDFALPHVAYGETGIYDPR